MNGRRMDLQLSIRHTYPARGKPGFKTKALQNALIISRSVVVLHEPQLSRRTAA